MNVTAPPKETVMVFAPGDTFFAYAICMAYVLFIVMVGPRAVAKVSPASSVIVEVGTAEEVFAHPMATTIKSPEVVPIANDAESDVVLVDENEELLCTNDIAPCAIIGLTVIQNARPKRNKIAILSFISVHYTNESDIKIVLLQ